MADAYIYTDSEGEARVYPPVLMVPENAEITFHNRTDETYALFIEEGVLSETVDEDEVPIETKAIRQQGKATLKCKRHPQKDVIFYSVMTQSGKKAKGNSDPVIIIEM